MTTEAIMKQQDSLLGFQKLPDLSNESSKSSLVVSNSNQEAEQIRCKYCKKEILNQEGKRHKSYCNNKCSQKYRYYSNRESLLRKKREYDNKNKEVVREQYREWYKRNKEKKIEQKKLYYLNHKEEYKKYNKKHRESLREQLNAYDFVRTDRTIYYRIEKSPYLKWRKNFCELCGFDIDIRVLDVHHIDGLLKNTKKDSENNVLTLCKNCHALVHLLSKDDWINLIENLKGNRIVLSQIKCLECNNKFVPLKMNQEFCTKKCYQQNIKKDPNFIKKLQRKSKEYYDKNRSKILQHQKEHNNKNKENRKCYNNKYYIENKERLKEYQKIYRQKQEKK